MSSFSGSYSRIALPSIQLPLPSAIIAALYIAPFSKPMLSTYSPVFLFVITMLIFIPLPKRSLATFFINVSMAPNSVRSCFATSSITFLYGSPAFPAVTFFPSDPFISCTPTDKFARLLPTFSQFCFVTLSSVIISSSTKMPVSLSDISQFTVTSGPN